MTSDFRGWLVLLQLLFVHGLLAADLRRAWFEEEELYIENSPFKNGSFILDKRKLFVPIDMEEEAQRLSHLLNYEGDGYELVHHNRTKRQTSIECFVPTTGGNVNENTPCHFPFRYKGKTYHSCTKKNHGKKWCSTTHYYNIDKKWGNCKDTCKTRSVTPYNWPAECQNVYVKSGGTSQVGEKCVFPFNMLGEKYYRCTTNFNDGIPWCYTDNSGNYGHCIQTVWTVGGTAPTGSKCKFPFKYNGKSYYQCTNVHNQGDPWCSINEQYKPLKQWGYCDYKCDPQAMGPLTTPGNCPGFQCSLARVSNEYRCEVMAERKDEERPCRFPFSYKGKEYWGCTGRDNGGRKWCYVEETNEAVKIRWGNCIIPTSGGNADGQDCYIPYKHNGKWKKKCITGDFGTPMCSVTKLSSANKWGFCMDVHCRPQ